MHFASPIPWWLTLAAAAAIASLAYLAYRRPPVPLSIARRSALTALRALSMALLVFFLCRPIIMRPPEGRGGVVVPILVDGSRSMRVADVDGRPRIERAVSVLERDLLPALGNGFKPELLVFGEALVPAASPSEVGATARQTDLGGALAAVRDRYRGQPLAAIVVISDGGDTGGSHVVGADDEDGAARVRRRRRLGTWRTGSGGHRHFRREIPGSIRPRSTCGSLPSRAGSAALDSISARWRTAA